MPQETLPGKPHDPRTAPESQCFAGAFVRGYRRVGQVASGKRADIFLAERVASCSLVALKVVRDEPEKGEAPDSFLRFLHEYEIAQRIRHPGIVRLFDLGVSDEHAWLVMEYFPRGDLRRRMKSQVAPRWAVGVAAAIARALAALHAGGVVHRDLKPGNVMLREDGGIALIDFGLSKDTVQRPDLTERGLIFGTPHYMSPEQGHGEPTDARSDLYSLGIILYEMLTGGKPYRAESPMALIYKHRKAPVPQLAAGLDGMQPLLERLLAKRPEERFPSALAAADALDRQLERFLQPA
ncbi:MAG: serine/threonine protein kinase [Gammaproteobacteria bacterium]|nr:serine/threonine protein kinase [Gammaproteobacteria bacterium]MDE2262824.1 serine/threonine protein kinase [Gammaproteobacteria bacterium]